MAYKWGDHKMGRMFVCFGIASTRDLGIYVAEVKRRSARRQGVFNKGSKGLYSLCFVNIFPNPQSALGRSLARLLAFRSPASGAAFIRSFW